MRIIIASHGTLAAGIKNSAEVILGPNDRIDTICAYVDETIDYQKLIKRIIENHDYQKEQLIVLTDLLGGSVNTEFLKHINEYDFYLVSGVNLPLLIEIAVSDDINEEKLNAIVSKSQNNMKVFNKLLLHDDEDDDFE